MYKNIITLQLTAEFSAWGGDPGAPPWPMLGFLPASSFVGDTGTTAAVSDACASRIGCRRHQVSHSLLPSVTLTFFLPFFCEAAGSALISYHWPYSLSLVFFKKQISFKKLFVYVCAWVWAWVGELSTHNEADVRASGTALTGNCETPHWCWEWNSSPLQEQYELWTPELSLQPRPQLLNSQMEVIKCIRVRMKGDVC